MKTSPNGMREIKLHEGVRNTAYKDVVGIWTIGVGHTAAAGPPTPIKGMTITDAEVNEILARDLVKFEKAVGKAVKVPVNQNQYDALVSWTFNIGEGAMAKSTLIKKLNKGDYQGAADQFDVWINAGGQPVQGLINRRKKEKALFLKPVDASQKPVEAPPAPVVIPPATPAPEKPKGFWAGFLEALVNAIRKK